MPTYQVQSVNDGKPILNRPWKEVLANLKFGGGLKTLSPVEYITDQQRRWYKGVCLRDLVKHDQNGESLGWWDDEVKRQCKGLAYLKKEIYYQQDALGQKIGIGRLTTRGVGIRNMTAFIEEILSVAMAKGWPISPPDPELRKKEG